MVTLNSIFIFVGANVNNTSKTYRGRAWWLSSVWSWKQLRIPHHWEDSDIESEQDVCFPTHSSVSKTVLPSRLLRSKLTQMWIQTTMEDYCKRQLCYFHSASQPFLCLKNQPALSAAAITNTNVWTQLWTEGSCKRQLCYFHSAPATVSKLSLSEEVTPKRRILFLFVFVFVSVFTFVFVSLSLSWRRKMQRKMGQHASKSWRLTEGRGRGEEQQEHR